jgi:hypothetical protein
MAVVLNVGEDFSMLDASGRVDPDLERIPVTGFRAHAERIIRRWLAHLGMVWYARNYGAGVLDLLNAPAGAVTYTSKAQELRQQAMAEPGTTSARVSIKREGEAVRIVGIIDVRGQSGTIALSLNGAQIELEIDA